MARFLRVSWFGLLVLATRVFAVVVLLEQASRPVRMTY